MQKKLRYYWWLIKGLFSRYARMIVGFFVSGIILVVFLLRVMPLVVKSQQNPTRVIGMVGTFSPTNLPLTIQRLISTGLTDTDESGMPLPAIAKEWHTNEEGTIYTFTLRDDLFWHDGQKFSSFDVNYNLKDVEFKPVSETVLEVVLKEPFSPLPNYLSKPLFKKGLIGLGPYKLDSIRLRGDTVSFLRLLPVSLELDLPILEIKFYASEEIAKTAFKLGEVNMLDQMSSAKPFTEWKNIIVKETPELNKIVAIYFNNADPLLSVKETRQALAYAIEKPLSNRVATPLSSKSWAYTNRVKQYERDLDVARDLAPQSSGSAVLTLSTYTAYLPQAQVIAAAWNSIGITTKVKVEDGRPSNFQALLVTQEIPTDPDQYTLWHSTQTQTNITQYNYNKKIDKLLEDGRKEQDLEKRKKIYFDFQRYLVDDAPAVFLNHPSTYTISRQ